MEKVIPSFQYEPLVISLELETLDEEETKEILMVQDHQVHEQKRKNQETAEEGRIALKRRPMVWHMH